MASPGLGDFLGGFAVERKSPIPLYFQVATYFERGIQAGLLPPGTLFDNEIRIAEQLGVSRPTMRRALEQLVDQGLIVRRRGIGTRVVQPQVRRPLELTSLYDDLARAGRHPTTHVLDFQTRPATAEMAEALGVETGTPVVSLQRLRSARGEPIALMTNVLPADLVEFGADDLAGAGLYELLRRSGIHLHSATQIVAARNATSAESNLLELARGSALLTVDRTTLDDSGRVVEVATHLYVASNYSFEIHLVEP